MKRLIVFMVLVQLIFASYVKADDERFILSNLVVKDKKVPKVWTRDANVIGHPMTWDAAFKAVKNLNEQKYAGLQCWRLPEKEELLALSAYISAKAKVSIKGKGGLEPFTHVQPSLYWSTTHSTYNDVWVMDLVFDSVSVVSKKSLYYVWPVCDYDKKELEADERQIAEERKRQEQLQAALEAVKVEETRRRALVEEKEKDRISKLCDGVVLTQMQFLSGKNVFADKGKCVELSASTFQMVSVNEGLFEIGANQIAYIKFKNIFRGVGVRGLVKIKGMKSYTTRLGYVNEVPYLEMLEIEEVYGGRD